MKKALAAMAAGVGVGAAGSFFIYTQYKNGNMQKMINKVGNKAGEMMNNM